ncbi:hypothetical protein SNE40_010412 [Patella caerulea]|uniref:Uncharacterized protein n=1 Tax=Patella caerulea TaxID=87958 RepID=A0AAN8PST4_PATCE
MNGKILFAFTVVVVLSTMSIASPVLPVYDLDLMPPEMACLYICNICYDGRAEEMKACANDICSKPGCNILDYMKIGRDCNNYKTVFEYSTGAFKKH